MLNVTDKIVNFVVIMILAIVLVLITILMIRKYNEPTAYERVLENRQSTQSIPQ